MRTTTATASIIGISKLFFIAPYLGPIHIKLKSESSPAPVAVFGQKTKTLVVDAVELILQFANTLASPADATHRGPDDHVDDG